MVASVLCVSHTDGALGRAVGRAVADSLGFRYIDEGIVVAAAQERHVLPEAVALAETRGTGRDIEVDFGRYERTESLRELIRDTIASTAEEGRVVIVSHAASYALAARPGVLRVLVTASAEIRAGRHAAANGIDGRRAAKELAESDRGRADYLRRFYGVKDEAPSDYDLVLNTDRLTVEDAAATVVAAASG